VIAYTIHPLKYASSNKHKKDIAISKSNRVYNGDATKRLSKYRFLYNLFDHGKAIRLQVSRNITLLCFYLSSSVEYY